MAGSEEPEIKEGPTALELGQIRTDLRYALEAGEGHLPAEAIPRLVEVNREFMADRKIYPKLEFEFMEVMAQDFFFLEGEFYLGTRVYCPFCDWKSGLVWKEDWEVSLRDQNLLSPLYRHLVAQHHFTKIIRRKERPEDHRKLTTYECVLCGTELKGVISALIHFIEHIWFGEGERMRLDAPPKQGP